MNDNEPPIGTAMGLAIGASSGVSGAAYFGDLTMHTLYRVECWTPSGVMRWMEQIYNMVVNEGLNDLLQQYFKGSGYTAAWAVGLIDNANFGAIAATDTAAKISAAAPPNPPTTNNWSESQAYSESVRQNLALGSVSGQSVDNSAARATFSINATATLNGAFVDSSNVKGGTAGKLYGAASFSTPRPVESGDQLLVAITLSAASA